jgi:hypothetical protein
MLELIDVKKTFHPGTVNAKRTWHHVLCPCRQQQNRRQRLISIDIQQNFHRAMSSAITTTDRNNINADF